MMSRKLSPLPSSRSSMKPPLLSAEYVDAMNVLSEDTMTQVCSLLLSEKDYDNNDVGDDKTVDEKADNNSRVRQEEDNKSKQQEKAAAGTGITKKKSDRDQLLDIYKKCRDAAKVVADRQPLDASTSSGLTGILPSLPVVRNAAGAASIRGGNQPTVKPTVKGAAAMSLLTAQAGRRISRQQPKSKRSAAAAAAQRQQQEGDGAVKKPRLMVAAGAGRSISPPSSSQGAAPADAPPPKSVLNFLAKLNKDKKDITSGSSKNEKKAPESSTKKEQIEPSSPPARRQPTRTQPSRATRSK